MITDFFKATKKLGIGLAVGSALAMSASSTFAGGNAIYYEKDFSDTTAKVAKYGAGKVSNKLGGVTFLVYGGNEKLQSIARSVAKRLNSEGMPVGFIRALDRDSIPETMSIAFYTKGGYQYAITAYDNDNITVEQGKARIYDQAKKAYEAEFGSEKITKKAPAGDKPVLVNG